MNNSMIKRSIALIAVVAIIALGFAACDSKPV